MTFQKTVRTLLTIYRLTFTQLSRFERQGFLGGEREIEDPDELTIYRCVSEIDKVSFDIVLEAVFNNLGIEICNENGFIIDEFTDDVNGAVGVSESLVTMGEIDEYMDEHMPELYEKYKIDGEVKGASIKEILSTVLQVRLLAYCQINRFGSEGLDFCTEGLFPENILTIGLCNDFIYQLAHNFMRNVALEVIGGEESDAFAEFYDNYEPDSSDILMDGIEKIKSLTELSAEVERRIELFCEKYGIK